MSDAWKQKLLHLFISHHAIASADTTVIIPSGARRGKQHCASRAWNSKCGCGVSTVQHFLCLRVDCSAEILQPTLLVTRPHFPPASPRGGAALLFPFTAHFLRRSRCPSQLSTPLSVAPTRTHALALFPQQRALWKCQVSLFTCPLLALALLL